MVQHHALDKTLKVILNLSIDLFIYIFFTFLIIVVNVFFPDSTHSGYSGERYVRNGLYNQPTF